MHLSQHNEGGETSLWQVEQKFKGLGVAIVVNVEDYLVGQDDTNMVFNSRKKFIITFRVEMDSVRRER